MPTTYKELEINRSVTILNSFCYRDTVYNTFFSILHRQFRDSNMISPSDIPSAFLRLPSNGTASPELTSTYLEQVNSFPLVIAELFPYPVPELDVARKRAFKYVSLGWDTHIKTASQILEASADESTNLDYNVRPLMPNSVMRSATYLQHVYPQMREEERPPRYDLIGPSEALNLTGNKTITAEASVTENEPGIGEDFDEVSEHITVEDSHGEKTSNTNGVSLTNGSFKVENEPSTDILSHGEMDPSSASIDDSSHEMDSEEKVVVKTEPFQEEMEYHTGCCFHFKQDAVTYESSDEEKVAIKMEHSPEEMDNNFDDSFCGEEFVQPVIASTSGAQQPAAGHSQRGKHKVGRIVSIWTIVTKKTLSY